MVLYGTSKTRKFAFPDIITTEKLKFQPTIAQTGIYVHNSAQLIAEYC